MSALNKELKEAIVAMPSVEKDKLLLRLLAKEPVLCEKLEHQLLGNSSDVEQRRQEIRDQILLLARMNHYSPGYMMMDMRSVNALITYHVKITRDKYAEVELTLLLLNKVFDHQLPHISTYNAKSDTLAAYVAKRTEFILQKMKKLHPDLHLEFAADLNLLLQRVHQYAPARYAKEMQLPTRWD